MPGDKLLRLSLCLLIGWCLMPVFPVCAWQDADGHTATNAADTLGDTEGLQYDTGGSCTWNANGLNVGVGAGVQSVDNIGTSGTGVLTFGLGITCGVDGTIGESGATLGTMNIYDGTLTLGVADGNEHFIDLIAFKADGELEVTNDNNIWGYVTTSTDGYGTLDLNGTTAVSGTVGTITRALKNIEAGDTGEVATFNGDVYVDLLEVVGDGEIDFIGSLTNRDNSTDIDFTGDATLIVAGDFAGDQIVVGANAATLVFVGAATFDDYTTGPGASVASFNGAVTADTIALSTGATVNLNGGFTLTTGIINDGDGRGTVNINAAATVAQDIAADASKLAALTVSGCSLITGNNIYADTFTITGNGGSLFLLGNVLLKGDTLITLNAGDTATLDVGPYTLTCDSAAFALNASNMLSLDLTGLGTSGKVDITNVADDGASVSAAAAIDVNTNGQYVPDGQVFTVIDADNAHAGGAGYAAPGTVTDNSALLAFTSGTANGGQDIIITASRTTTYDAIGGNRNSRAAGEALEAAGQSGPSADMQVVLGALDALDKAIAISQALDQVYSSPDAAGVVQADAAVNEALNTVLSHLGSTRSAVGMGQGDAGYFGKKIGIGRGEFDLFDENPIEGLAVWAKGFGAYDHQKDHDAVKGYDSYMGGVSFGVDAKREGNLLLGAGAGFAQTQVDGDHASGTDTDILTILGSLYCGYDGTLDSIEGEGLYAEAVGTMA